LFTSGLLVLPTTRGYLLTFRFQARAFGSVFATLCISFATETARAESDSGEPMALTLEAALETALEESPLVRRARQETKKVRARKVDAELLLPANPNLQIGAGRRSEAATGSDPKVTGLQFNLQLGQNINVAGQRAARIEVVDRAVAASLARETLAVVETKARVRIAYVSAALARQQLESAREYEGLAQQFVEAVKRQVAEGAASEIDLQLATLQRVEVERERLEAERNANLALSPLRAILNLHPQRPINITSRVALPEEREDILPSLIATAEKTRAEFAALDKSKQELDATLVSLGRQAIPDPQIYLSIQQDLPGQYYLGGGVQVDLPTFRRNQGPKAEVRASIEQLENDRALLSRSVAIEVAAAHHNVLALRDQVKLVEAKVLPAADRSAELLREGWRSGKFDFFRVIQASREAWSARRNYYRILGDLWLASTELDRAAGRL